LDGDLDDFVYDYYHAGTSFASQSFDRVHVRLPTDEELQVVDL
jgi:predicted metal-dependent hydrolase